MTYPWQQNALAQLEKMLAQSRIANALLIAGPQGLGKQTLANYLIKRILCSNVKNKTPCERCSSCLALKRDDLSDAASQKDLYIRHSNEPSVVYCRRELNKQGKLSQEIRIDQIRHFCEALHKTAAYYKIGLLWYADTMNEESTDSLLKTLEEPPQNTLIILLAHQRSALKKTILSRCQTIMLTANNDNETKHWLSEQIAKQAPEYQEKSEEILALSHNCPLSALAMVKNEHYQLYQIWRHYLLTLANKPQTIINTIPQALPLGLNCLADLLKALITAQLLGKCDDPAMATIIARSNPYFLLKLLDDVQRAINLLQTSVNINLLLDNILIVWSHITHLADYPEIIKT